MSVKGIEDMVLYYSGRPVSELQVVRWRRRGVSKTLLFSSSEREAVRPCTWPRHVLYL